MRLYQYLSDITPSDALEYGVLMCFTMFIVTRVLRPSWMQLVALAMGLVMVAWRVDRRRVTTERAFTEMEMRLKELYPKPQNFHMDADITNIFYNARDFRKYHSEGYDEALVAVDNMLKTISEMEAGVYHCYENLQIVRDSLNKAMNHFQTIVFQLPSNIEMQRRFKRTLNALHVLLRRHVDDMVKLCREQMGGGPREVDRSKLNSRASEFYPSAGYSPPGALEKRTIDIAWHPVDDSGPRPNDLDNLESSRFDFYY